MTLTDVYFWCREANTALAPIVLAALAFRAIPLLFTMVPRQWKAAIVIFHLYVLMSGAVSAQLLVNDDAPGPTAPATTALHLALIGLMVVWSETEIPERWRRDRSPKA